MGQLNGEIYNFMELRRELEAKGYVFRSHSDTEVIVYGYAAWGEKVFNRLRGMFAIAIWDRVNRKLLLGRDRFGKKPLYYAQVRDLILFGSEIKELLTWPEVSRQPDNVAIDQFLTLQYVLSPRTAFEAVRKSRRRTIWLPNMRSGWLDNRLNIGDFRSPVGEE